MARLNTNPLGVMNMRNTFDTYIPEDAWEPTGVEEDTLSSRLSVTLFINGVPHHLEAYEVKINEKSGAQEPVDVVFESNIGGIGIVSEPDGPWHTVSIKGKEYVVVMTPFC